MGTPDFAVQTLAEIILAKHEVVGVITQPDKPKGRGQELQASPVKELALKHNLDVYQPLQVKDLTFVEQLKQMRPDVIVVVAFGQIISRDILDIPQYGCINVHASLLPKYRGAAPIQWEVIDGEEQAGVTIMRMDEGIDTGDMIAKTTFMVSAEETGGSLFAKSSQAGAQLLVKVLDDIKSGRAVYEKQPQISPTPYAKMISKQMGLIDFNEEAVVIERLIRGLNPWPSAYTKIDGKTLKLWSAIVSTDETGNKPGTLVAKDQQVIWIQTGKGLLGIKELQLEGKKRLLTADFSRGFEISIGRVLGE